MIKALAVNRSFWCLLVTAMFLLHSAEIVKIPLLSKVENIAYDQRLKLTMPSTIDPRIVILDIDEKSLAAEGRWPWSRDKMSDLVELLFDFYQIKILGFDIVFSEADNSSGLNLLENLSNGELSNNPKFLSVLDRLRARLNFDNVFAHSLKDRDVVLGYYFNKSEANINPGGLLPLPLGNITEYPELNLSQEKGYGANLSVIQNSTGVAGYFNNNSVDSDGSFRRLPLVAVYENNIYEALPLAVYRKLLGNPKVDFTFEEGYGGNARLESVNIESLSIPVNDDAVALVPYRGYQGSFKYISVTDVLNGVAKVPDLAGKIVLMGATAAGLSDLRTTPVQSVYPGVEVHANLISGMLDDSFKSRPNYLVGIELLELIVLAGMVIFIYPKLTPKYAALMLGALTTLIFGFNLYAWNMLNMDNFLATPLLLLAALFLIQIYFSYILETKKRNKLGAIFGQYIPKSLVAEMGKTDKEYSLKGENKEMTVFFSDVRNFTSISEKMDSESLSQLMNEVLSPITKVIHNQNGTIDKYIGDAVMAFWGAPIDDENHASNAVAAALEFTPALDAINAEFTKKSWPYIDIGVGINTGEMSVGNMGSEFRIAYTVMGDAVNLGARLEGLTKQYGLRVLVSESTKNAAPEFAYLEVDRVQVKGRQEPVTIYEPISLLATITNEADIQIKAFDGFLTQYRKQNWPASKSLIEGLIEKYPNKALFTMYLNRVEAYILEAPGEDWNGVFEHKTK